MYNYLPFIFIFLLIFLGFSCGQVVANLTYYKQNQRKLNRATEKGILIAFDRYAEVVKKANGIGSGPVIMKDGTTLSDFVIFMKDSSYGVYVKGNNITVKHGKITNM